MDTKKIFFTGIALVVLASFVLSACSSGQVMPTPTPVDVRPIYTAAMQTAIAEVTRNAPTATATATITPTPVPTDTPTLTPTATALVLSLETNIAIYMVNPIYQEKCKYEVLPIPVNRGVSGDMLTDIQQGATYLFYTKSETLGSLTNPLSASNLQFVNVDVSGTSMVIHLTGTVYRSDDSCLNEEARAQVWATVGRYIPDGFTLSGIWVDDKLFDDLILNG